MLVRKSRKPALVDIGVQSLQLPRSPLALYYSWTHQTRQGVFRSVWNPHKSKDQVFLHRSYAQLFFSVPKKMAKIFFQNRKSEKTRKFSIFDFFDFCSKILDFLSKKYFFQISKKKFKKIFLFFYFRSQKKYFLILKKNRDSFRCKKLWSLDCRCFRSDPSAPTARTNVCVARIAPKSVVAPYVDRSFLAWYRY